MGARPNIDHLKESCGSNQLQHCFKYLFVQEWRENEDLIRYIGQKCADLGANIQRRAQLIQEGESFGLFDNVAPDAVECMGWSEIVAHVRFCTGKEPNYEENVDAI
ncbi:hypothetical protein CTI12_AA563120 [Artemisia annua]|uniref:Uncharacterized protein n=1 Tax=Artemisia annua TaxID=35608 RepID=A0A2U1KUF8_ARTAN|nr:hypothetical protein CTI12_AA563120 [Artemisia annua]